MKNKILIFTIIAGGFAISTDTQAMWRTPRVKVAPVLAQYQKTIKRPLSSQKQEIELRQIRENKFPMPNLPVHRMDRQILQNYQKHDDLCLKWYENKKSIAECKSDLKSISAMALPVSASSLVMPVSDGMPILLCSAWIVYASIRDFKDVKKAKRAIEAELANLAKEHRNEFKIRDDIQ